MKGWLEHCIETHPKCHLDNTGNDHVPSPPTLPSRILYLDDQNDPQSCRLLITNGARGYYAALSHCWGSLQPLTTRRESLLDHLQHILYMKLPKTFQDAVTVCKELGIMYLWIDSLCILQDDQDDWRKESAVMGEVYRNSLITISATSAADADGGLFMSRPSKLDPVPIAYNFGSFQKHSTVYFALHPDEVDSTVDNSPLDSRAWITQEWLLSKRVLHYTQASIIWSCCTTTEVEDGETLYSAEQEDLRSMLVSIANGSSPESEFDFVSSWCDIVRSYCSRSLTFDTDKPVAIQGLANLLSTHANLPCQYGIWLPEKPLYFPVTTESSSQLFWYGKYSRARNYQSLSVQYSEAALRRPSSLQWIPTWSWMSTVGHLSFHNPSRTAQQVAEELHISGRNLCIKTCKAEMPVAWGPVLPDTQLGERWPLNAWFSQQSFLSSAMVVPHGLYLIGATASKFGWVSLDQGTLPADRAYCCAISRTVGDDGSFDAYNVIILVQRGLNYARVGMGEIIDPSLFLGLMKEQISVI